MAPYSMPTGVYFFIDKVDETTDFALNCNQFQVNIIDDQTASTIGKRLDGRAARGGQDDVPPYRRILVSNCQRLYKHVRRYNLPDLLAFLRYRLATPRVLDWTDEIALEILYHAMIIRQETGTASSVHPVLDEVDAMMVDTSGPRLSDVAMQFGLVEYGELASCHSAEYQQTIRRGISENLLFEQMRDSLGGGG
ncbi:hypothetical protein N431DRAFT_475858 [Stipitochalara longipes BDJ]|nr:hypothetical protein N431DRAFT_475858 [Stipitochalara longipes BDJ]